MAPETIIYGYLITAGYRMLMTFKIWPMVDIFMELPVLKKGFQYFSRSLQIRYRVNRIPYNKLPFRLRFIIAVIKK